MDPGALQAAVDAMQDAVTIIILVGGTVLLVGAILYIWRDILSSPF